MCCKEEIFQIHVKKYGKSRSVQKSAKLFHITFKVRGLQLKKKQRQKQLGAYKLVTTQIWKLKNFMSLFSTVFSLPVPFEFFPIFSYCLHFVKFVGLLCH
jgi:hypothetical protein